ncbi:MAG TPA: Asp-tRNA(Asn)/Glu-tRNA(Gln) amidotransferase subunit GatC [Longimicrobiales bacterium]|nr:Asp-tRNA(Asn)/Glu-tRNA(Gln) amidotransferase subunit GatC [Longimicrobiales bacterium]
MPVRREDVLAVARLARLSMDAAEADRMAGQLNGILAHMDALREIDVDGVPPFLLAAHGVARLRDDVTGADPLLREPADVAAAWRDGFFVVPRLEAQGGGAEDSG